VPGSSPPFDVLAADQVDGQADLLREAWWMQSAVSIPSLRLRPSSARRPFSRLLPAAERTRRRELAQLVALLFSVTYTGMNFLPLCTAKVCPTMSGMTVDRRDQVLTTFLSKRLLRSSIFF
jgi:hypothetical protein